MSSLLIVTTNHPFTYTGGETMFVGPELRRLARTGLRIRVAPLHAQGQRLPLPAGVELDLSLSQSLPARRLRSAALAPAWPGFAAEFARALRQGGPVGMARVWRWSMQAQAVWSWVQNQVEPGLAYTYWRGGATLALARWARQRPGRAVVSRVHGYDLYEDRFQPPFQPYPGVYADLARVATVSQHGFEYLFQRGVAASRLRCARLGTEAAPQRARASDGQPWQILSCAHAIALKRLPLLAQALLDLAQQHPDQKLAWTHLGDGPDLQVLKTLARRAPANLQVHLPGAVGHDAVMQHYQTNAVDLFVLPSANEGLAVSAQEALSFGVPVLATDVGGMAEAVDASVGRLLPADLGAPMLAQAVADLLWGSTPTQRQARRAAARARWAERFDAEANHTQWANELAALAATLRP